MTRRLEAIMIISLVAMELGPGFSGEAQQLSNERFVYSGL